MTQANNDGQQQRHGFCLTAQSSLSYLATSEWHASGRAEGPRSQRDHDHSATWTLEGVRGDVVESQQPRFHLCTRADFPRQLVLGAANCSCANKLVRACNRWRFAAPTSDFVLPQATGWAPNGLLMQACVLHDPPKRQPLPGRQPTITTAQQAQARMFPSAGIKKLFFGIRSVGVNDKCDAVLNTDLSFLTQVAKTTWYDVILLGESFGPAFWLRCLQPECAAVQCHRLLTAGNFDWTS